MVTYNSLTFENIDFIFKRAKGKEDGVYTIRGILYKVKNHKPTHFACQGEILQYFGHFTVVLAKYKDRDQAKKILNGEC